MTVCKRFLFSALLLFAITLSVTFIDMSAGRAWALPQTNAPAYAPANPTSDATVIQGVNTAGTVRVNNMANLEYWVGMTAEGIRVIFCVYGLWLMIKTLRDKSAIKGKKLFGLAKSVALLALGVLAPIMIDQMLFGARGCGLVLFD